MVTMTSLRITFLFFTAYYCSLTLAAPWIVTKYLQETTISLNTRFYTDSYATEAIWVSLTAEDPSLLATTTTTNSFATDVTYVNIFVEPSQGKSYDRSEIGVHTYWVHVTRTWPETCASTGTYTTDSVVDVPYQIEWAVTPTATATIKSQYYTNGIALTETMEYLDPTDLPSDVRSSLLSDPSPPEFEFCSEPGDFGFEEGCWNVTWHVAGTAIGGEHCCGEDDCHRTWGIERWALAPIIIGAWFGFVLLVSLIYSFVGFRKLMTGQRAPRGIPGPFICLLPILSCILLLALRKGYQAKPPEERAELRSKWEAMSIGKKMGLWLRWGFSYKYPPMLGTPPPKIGSKSAENSPPASATTGEAMAQGAETPYEPPPLVYSAASRETEAALPADETQDRR